MNWTGQKTFKMGEWVEAQLWENDDTEDLHVGIDDCDKWLNTSRKVDRFIKFLEHCSKKMKERGQ